MGWDGVSVPLGRPRRVAAWAALLGIIVLVVMSSGQAPVSEQAEKYVSLDIVIGFDPAMTRHFPETGETAMERSMSVVRRWVSATNFDRHQVGIARLDPRGDLIHELSKDKLSLLASVIEVESSRRTCLRAGLQTISKELSSSRRRSGTQGVAILLTDGRSQAAAAHLVARQMIAKQNIVIIAIGMGESPNETLLSAISSFPEDLDSTSDEDELLMLYSGWIHRLESQNDLL